MEKVHKTNSSLRSEVSANNIPEYDLAKWLSSTKNKIKGTNYNSLYAKIEKLVLVIIIFCINKKVKQIIIYKLQIHIKLLLFNLFTKFQTII